MDMASQCGHGIDWARAPQRGQALAEALVVLGVLAVTWLAVAWLGRLRDLDLQALHASRHHAFMHAHQGMTHLPPAADSPFLSGAGQHWGSRHAPSLLAGAHVRLYQEGRVSGRRPGDTFVSGSAVRRELKLGDEAVWVSEVDLSTAGLLQVTGDLRDFDGRSMRLRRHTAILRGDGAASGDTEVQSTLAAASVLWHGTAHRSVQLAGLVDIRMRALDAPWGRADLQTDWLTPWTGRLPARHLRPGGQP